MGRKPPNHSRIAEFMSVPALLLDAGRRIVDANQQIIDILDVPVNALRGSELHALGTLTKAVAIVPMSGVVGPLLMRRKDLEARQWLCMPVDSRDGEHRLLLAVEWPMSGGRQVPDFENHYKGVILGLNRRILEGDADQEELSRALALREIADGLFRRSGRAKDLAALDAKQFIPLALPFDIVDVVDGTVRPFGTENPLFSPMVRAEIDPSAHGFYLGDATRLREVLRILCAHVARSSGHDVHMDVVRRALAPDGIACLMFEIRPLVANGRPVSINDRHFDLQAADAASEAGDAIHFCRRFLDGNGGSVDMSTDGDAPRARCHIPLKEAVDYIPSREQTKRILQGKTALIVADVRHRHQRWHWDLSCFDMKATSFPGTTEKFLHLARSGNITVDANLCLVDVATTPAANDGLAQVVRSLTSQSKAKFAIISDTHLTSGCGWTVERRAPVGNKDVYAQLARLFEAGAPKTTASISSIGCTQKSGRFPDRPVRVLMVDSNRLNQKVVDAFFTYEDVVLDFAHTGAETVEAVRMRGYDLVLMEARFEVVRHIRELPYPECLVPIIAVTAYGLAGARAECIAAGFDFHMPFPIYRDRLLQKLHLAGMIAGRREWDCGGTGGTSAA